MSRVTNHGQMPGTKRPITKPPGFDDKKDGESNKKQKIDDGKPKDLPPGFPVPASGSNGANGQSSTWVAHGADWKFLPSRSVFHKVSSDEYFLYTEKTGQYTKCDKPMIDASGNDLELQLDADSSVMQGRREKQEDRHAVIKDLHKVGKALKAPLDHLPQPSAMYSVFDGHQGKECSEFCAKIMPVRIIKKLAQIKDGVTFEKIQKMFEDTFEEVDKEFMNRFRSSKDGTTAVIVLIIGNMLYCAGCGDSEALVGVRMENGSTKCIPVNVNHNPKDDVKRVEAAGGLVINRGGVHRVVQKDFEETIKRIRKAESEGLGGEREPVALAVARALGDKYFKTPDPLIICKPDVKQFELKKGQAQFVTLFCDGVTDVMSRQAVVDLVAFHGAKPKKAASSLVSQAYANESMDNLTAIVAFFNWHGHEFGMPNQKNRKFENQKIRARHILFKHKDTRAPYDQIRKKPVERTKIEAVTRINDALTLLRTNKKMWDTICKDISECSSVNSEKGPGDLGQFARGKMTKEFDDVVFALGVGELSKAVETDSGIHIIERLE